MLRDYQKQMIEEFLDNIKVGLMVSIFSRIFDIAHLHND